MKSDEKEDLLKMVKNKLNIVDKLLKDEPWHRAILEHARKEVEEVLEMLKKKMY